MRINTTGESYRSLSTRTPVGPQLSYESIDECLRINRTQPPVKHSNGEDPDFQVTLLVLMEGFSEML